MSTRTNRVVYFTGGPADLIKSHHSWKKQEHNPTEVSITFSSQIQQACSELGLPTLMISIKGPHEEYKDGLFTIEHRAKKRYSGLMFHIKEVSYAIGLLKDTLRFKANIALIDSGTTHFFLTNLFALFGIKVIPILHNTLWPTGFYPTKKINRVLLMVDKFLFWKRTPTALISVSPECERQVKTLTPNISYPTYQTRAQFNADYFKKIKPIQFPKDSKPFQIMFIGRVEKMKGVFDILKMAEYVNEKIPNKVKWKICGSGSDLEELKKEHAAKKLHESVELVGWTTLEQLIEIYNNTHCCIVPTRSIFTEALAMTAVESILANRPLISNPVVPATELIAPACLLGKTDDYISHAEQVIKVATNEDLYHQLSLACKGLADEFINPEYGLKETIKTVLTKDC